MNSIMFQHNANWPDSQQNQYFPAALSEYSLLLHDGSAVSSQIKILTHFTRWSNLFFLFPEVMIFLRGNLWRTLWFLCLMLPLAQGLHLCAWAASTCWCSCLSPVPCSSWPPGLASHFMAASYKESRPWGREPSMATLLMSRPYELKGAGLEPHTDTLKLFASPLVW